MEQTRTETTCELAQRLMSLSKPGAPEPSFVEALVDPVNLFCNPSEVIEHPWFTDGEKRTILLSWARDELVVEQVAAGDFLGTKPKSRIDAVIEALSEFDAPAAEEYRSAVTSIREGRAVPERARAGTLGAGARS